MPGVAPSSLEHGDVLAQVDEVLLTARYVSRRKGESLFEVEEKPRAPRRDSAPLKVVRFVLLHACFAEAGANPPFGVGMRAATLLRDSSIDDPSAVQEHVADRCCVLTILELVALTASRKTVATRRVVLLRAHDISDLTGFSAYRKGVRYRNSRCAARHVQTTHADGPFDEPPAP